MEDVSTFLTTIKWQATPLNKVRNLNRGLATWRLRASAPPPAQHFAISVGTELHTIRIEAVEKRELTKPTPEPITWAAMVRARPTPVEIPHLALPPAPVARTPCRGTESYPPEAAELSNSARRRKSVDFSDTSELEPPKKAKVDGPLPSPRIADASDPCTAGTPSEPRCPRLDALEHQMAEILHLMQLQMTLQTGAPAAPAQFPPPVLIAEQPPLGVGDEAVQMQTDSLDTGLHY
eukprot:6466535-Amphidinium_carterae.1